MRNIRCVDIIMQCLASSAKILLNKYYNYVACSFSSWSLRVKINVHTCVLKEIFIWPQNIQNCFFIHTFFSNRINVRLACITSLFSDGKWFWQVDIIFYFCFVQYKNIYVKMMHCYEDRLMITETKSVKSDDIKNVCVV